MARKSDFKKFKEEADYERNVLEALLVSSTCNDDFTLPTIKEFILSEVVNGTIEYVGGNAGQVYYQKTGSERSSFERDLYAYLESELETHSKEILHPKVSLAIKKLCVWHPCAPSGPERPYTNTELYALFSGFAGGGICPVIMKSSFSLPLETVNRVQREVIPSLSAPERRNIEGIAEKMRKYIDDDLEFIGRTYLW